MATDHEVVTIKLELGDVIVDSPVEFPPPLTAVTCELGVGKPDEVFSVLRALGDTIVGDEDGLGPVVIVEEEEA